MSSIPIFNQLNDSNLYELSTILEAGLSEYDYWAGYCANSSSSLGTSASTQEVWENIGGFYLFLKEKPTDWTIFEANLIKLRSRLPSGNLLRCLWIQNPNETVFKWKTSEVTAKSSSTGESITWTIQRAVAFNLGGYQYFLNGLSELQYIPDEEGGGITFSGGGNFSGPEGGYSFASTKIVFSGAQLGTFNGSLTIPLPSSESSNDLWTNLTIGIQYASQPQELESPNTPANLDETYDPTFLNYAATKILHMPVFGRQSAEEVLNLMLDPLYPFVASRTALALATDINSTVFESYFRTTRGYPITLKALPEKGSIPGTRFVFGSCPVRTNDPASGLRYHLSPDGAFQINVTVPTTTEAGRSLAISEYQLLLGLSGLEYVTMGTTNNFMLVFEGGNNAFVPTLPPDSKIALNVSEALTNLATTSYLTVMNLASNDPETNPGYYSQPKEAPIYSGRSAREDNLLDFNAMKAFNLSSNTSGSIPVFPVGVFAGLTETQTNLALEIENSSLAPYRHLQLGQAYGTKSIVRKEVQSHPKRRLRDAADPLGVTPQGLVAELTPDYSNFDGLILGNMPGTNYPKVDLTVIDGEFKESLQNNQLFFVAINVDVLMNSTSIRYLLTAQDKEDLEAAEVVPQDVIDNVYAAVDAAGHSEIPFDTEGEFLDCIKDTADGYESEFLEVGGILKVEMDGWTFQLSPRSWRVDPDTPTIMIAKFCNRSLLEMVKDSSSWSWPEVAVRNGGTLAGTQKVVLDVFEKSSAEDADGAYAIFYDEVVKDPTWNGFLFLNAPVDIGELPDDLKFLAAGVDLTQFYAHHIGFSQTPFNVVAGVPELEQTAAFGLIDYIDTLDLYSDETIQFGFKTMQLKARFANAALADFSAQVELMLNNILATPLFKNQADRGNNLIIDGSYQRIGGKPSYAFALTGSNLFNGRDSVVSSMEVLSVQLITGGDPSDENVLTTFILTGNLRFIIIEDFDMFSYGPETDGTDGYLRFGGLSINMNFAIATPNIQSFVVNEGAINFDLSNSSEPRTNSLLNNFPLVATSLIASPNLSPIGELPTGQTPEEMGYTSISAPLDQSRMTPSWYGLQFALDMGTLGALTGGESVKLSVLAAWSRGATDSDNPPVYIALKLPNIPAIGGSFPLQGVLKLGFRSFQFKTYDAGDGKLGYNLYMKQFALSVLVWSFPPGNTDIVLFGEPGNPRGSLGWYAAYDSGDSGSKQKAQQARMLETTDEVGEEKAPLNRVERRNKSGRRTPPVK